MTLTLQRTRYLPEGVFGKLMRPDGSIFLHTLEHAYVQGDGGITAKAPLGEYTCVRGPHRLHGMDADFETFEVTGVVGHKGILFHPGNYNRDSEGCILLGKGELAEMITDSRSAFNSFMRLMDGTDSFQLVIA